MSVPSIKDQVDKLVNLQTMARGVTALTTQTQENKQKIMTSIEGLLDKIKAIIGTHKESGKKASEACKQALQNADVRQSAIIQEIMKNINLMANTKSLEEAIAKLQADIDGLGGGPSEGPSGSNNQANDIEGSMFKNVPGVSDGPMVPDSKDPNNPANRNKALSPQLRAIDNSVTRGGYTYGKSRKKEKGRRKRTKKSRKKGKGSKRR